MRLSWLSGLKLATDVAFLLKSSLLPEMCSAELPLRERIFTGKTQLLKHDCRKKNNNLSLLKDCLPDILTDRI